MRIVLTITSVYFVHHKMQTQTGEKLMSKRITEIFVMTMKDADRADAVRERARADFLSLDGVDSWRTFVTIHPDKPTLFAEIYEFPNEETARQVTPEFAKREATKAFLAEVDEMLVGQYFVEHVSKETGNG